ncbi:MAG: DUF3329 domain-containing protein, partial [Burkholderiales bacterium]|nr:DUF3329 domain-containing protein [Burkholderiales bacterium]
MNGVWGRSLGLLLLLVLGCLLIWPLFGAAAAVATFVLALLLGCAMHVRRVASLVAWLSDPKPETVPHGTGIWEEVSSGIYRMIRHQRQSTSRLSATLDHFQRAGAAMPDGLVILDQANRIEWCNPKAEQHFGLDRRRDTGQQITYLVRYPQFTE